MSFLQHRAIGPESGRKLGQYLREALRTLFNFQPDPPGEAVGGEVQLDFDQTTQAGDAPAQQKEQ